MNNQTKLELSEHDKIIVYMFHNRNLISAKDLSNLKDKLFIGYECSARFSEIRNKIMKKYIIQETRGKFHYARIDFEKVCQEDYELYKNIENKHNIIYHKIFF